MAFVNEMISDDDWQRYDLDTVNRRMNGLHTPNFQWTIDREEAVWLRLFYIYSDYTADKPGRTGKQIWDYFWRGTLLSLETRELKTKPETDNDGVYYVHRRLLSINIPPELTAATEQILQDLKLAFTACSCAGIYSDGVPCQIDLEYRGQLI
ncbi:hypothetical protein ACMYSK_06705 [Klebsiella sp. I138]|uniref:hypothetical protein n=1 Tax=Klebsiella sp. I138 TaxID=2755385 RepID=UPI003DA80EBE